MDTSITKKRVSSYNRSRGASATSGPLIVEVDSTVAATKKSELLKSIDQHYDLGDLSQHLGIPLNGTDGNSELACIQSILQVNDIYKGRLPQCNQLAPLYTSPLQFPDVIMHSNGKVFLAEVHSGGMYDFMANISKEIYAAVDCIRLLRYADRSVSQFTAFMFQLRQWQWK